jgi:hypothetical protein
VLVVFLAEYIGLWLTFPPFTVAHRHVSFRLYATITQLHFIIPATLPHNQFTIIKVLSYHAFSLHHLYLSF